jgi:hypothetical protein
LLLVSAFFFFPQPMAFEYKTHFIYSTPVILILFYGMKFCLILESYTKPIQIFKLVILSFDTVLILVASASGKQISAVTFWICLSLQISGYFYPKPFFFLMDPRGCWFSFFFSFCEDRNDDLLAFFMLELNPEFSLLHLNLLYFLFYFLLRVVLALIFSSTIYFWINFSEWHQESV